MVEVGHPGLGAVAHAYFHFVRASHLIKFLLQVIHNLSMTMNKEKHKSQTQKLSQGLALSKNVVVAACKHTFLLTTNAILNFFQHYLLLHHVWVHIRDETNGELANDLAWDDSLCPCLGKSSLNSMK